MEARPPADRDPDRVRDDETVAREPEPVTRRESEPATRRESEPATRREAPPRARARDEELAAAHRAGVREGAARTTAQLFCLGVGLALIAGGVLGFFFGGDNFDTGQNVQGDDFLAFEVNGWHNIFHIASGAFLVLMAGRVTSAVTGALVFGLVYAAVAVLGFIDGDDLFNLIPIDSADNWLHVGLAALGLVVAVSAGALGLSGRREARRVGV